MREAERVYRNPKLPPIGDVTHPGRQRLRIAVCTKSILREASPEVRELTLKTAALLEELGHRVTEIDNPVPDRFKDDFLLYWSFLAFAVVRGGRRMFGPSFDRTRLDNLTLGLDRSAARNLHRLPLAIARLSGVAPDHRAVVGDLRRRADADAGRGRHRASAISTRPPTTSRSWTGSSNGCAFTPLQNATGEPAISLPLAESAAGLPVGMMLSTVIGGEARLLELAYELEEARPWPRIQCMTRDYVSTKASPRSGRGCRGWRSCGIPVAAHCSTNSASARAGNALRSVRAAARWSNGWRIAAPTVTAIDIDTRFIEPLACESNEVRRVDVRTDELPQAEFGLVHDPGFHGEGRIRARLWAPGGRRYRGCGPHQHSRRRPCQADRLDIAGLRFLSVVL